MPRKSQSIELLKKKTELKKRSGEAVEVSNMNKSYTDKKLEMFFKIDNITEKGEKREVTGIASAEIVDTGGDVVLHEAMKEAWAEYIKFGNIREMHQPSAVGTVIDHEFLDDRKATSITVKVVDDSAWEKVKTGVYKGFSIGARIKDAEFRIVDEKEVFVITKLELIEISLVDRPANQDSLIDSFKFISLSNDVMSKGILAKFMAKDKEIVKNDDTPEEEVIATSEAEDTTDDVDTPEATEDDTPEDTDTPEEGEDEDAEDDSEEEEDEAEEEDEEEAEEEAPEVSEEAEKSITVSTKVLEEILSKVSNLEIALEKSMAFNEKLVKGLDKAFVEVEKNVNGIQKSLDSFKKPKSVQKDMGANLGDMLKKEVSFESVLGKGSTWK